MKYFKITALLILVSCSSAKIVLSPEVPENAPENYQGIGEVEYKSKDRDDAFQLMFEACNGKYKILSENEGDTRYVSGIIGGNLWTIPQKRWRTRFRCE